MSKGLNTPNLMSLGIKLVFFIFFHILGIHLRAQNPYGAGFEFNVGYLDVVKHPGLAYLMDYYPQCRLHFFAMHDVCVQVKVAEYQLDTTFFVLKNTHKAFELPILDSLNFGKIHKTSIQISSNFPVQVVQSINTGIGLDQVQGFGKASLSEATAHIPSSNLIDSIYILNSVLNYPAIKVVGNGQSFFVQVTSMSNNNALRMQLGQSTVASLSDASGAIVQIAKDSVYDFTLHSDETITFLTTQLFLSGTIDTLQGSVIKSLNKKGFAVNVVNITPFCTIGGDRFSPSQEQLMPLSYWDTIYHFFEMPNISGGMYAIASSANQNRIFFNNNLVITLDSLMYYDTLFTGPLVIKSDYPIHISYVPCIPTSIAANNISTFSLAGLSDNQLVQKSAFVTIDETDPLNQYILAVALPTIGVNQFYLNDTLVSSLAFLPFPTDSSWSFGHFYLTKGFHVAACSSGFHGAQYTFHPRINTPNNYAFPNYGYLLGEAIEWPIDSFQHSVGLSPIQLSSFVNFNSISRCIGDTFYFQPNHARHTTWIWSFGDGTTYTQRVGSTRASAISHTFTNPGQYWVTVTDSAGCAQPDSLLIVVEPNPIADFAAETQLSCEGYYISLQNQSNGATSYNWQWPGGSSTAENPNFIYTGSSTQIPVTLIASNGNCTDTLVQNLEILTLNPEQIKLPNIITPNNDGVNDALCFEGTEGFADCFHLQIFNRWGGLVYQTRNPQDCWQATGMAGGVYFYVLTLGETKLQGSVTVMR